MTKKQVNQPKEEENTPQEPVQKPLTVEEKIDKLAELMAEEFGKTNETLKVHDTALLEILQRNKQRETLQQQQAKTDPLAFLKDPNVQTIIKEVSKNIGDWLKGNTGQKAAPAIAPVDDKAKAMYDRIVTATVERVEAQSKREVLRTTAFEAELKEQGSL